MACIGGEAAVTDYEPVIGLEVHAQLLTAVQDVLRLRRPTIPRPPPNTQVCPVCLGMPGVLPVINRARRRVRGA